MSFFNKMERKFGKYAIHNLMNYIVAMYVAGMIVQMMAPAVYWNYMALDAREILHGQIWRIVTFMIWPPFTNPLSNLIMIYLYYSLGNTLERVWGAFRFNVYIFMGVIGHVLAAIVVYLLFHQLWYLNTEYLNLSLIFAFGATFPDVQFMLYFFIPVKAKWLAWLDVLFFLYGIAQAFLPAYGGGVYGAYYQANALAAAVSLLNFVIFFIGSRNGRAYSPKQMRRKREFQKNVRRASRPAASYPNGAKHRCAVCGRTELDDPNLEFRYCSKCNGNYEYCQDHLFTHTHVK